jgi:hypothetical protein
MDDELRRTLRTWVGAPAGADWEPPPLPERLARRLLRTEEREQPHRDRWDCFEFSFCESYWEGRLLVPELDRFAQEQRQALAGRLDLVPLWPEGRPFAVCLTHDVDVVGDRPTPAQLVRSLRAARAEDEAALLRAARPAVRLARALAGGISRVPVADAALGRCVALEREYGVRSSYLFTVFPERGFSRYDCLYLPGDRCRFDGEETTVRDAMRALAAEGFDVGLHGSFNSALEPGMLAREKAALEEALGERVTTTRQHFLHWQPETTPALQEEAGLEVDSTLGFNRAIGFRCGASLPFRLPGRRLLEVPLAIHDGPLLRADGLELDAALAAEAVLRVVGEVEEVGGLATALFHPASLADPRFEAVYRALLEHALARGAWIASLRDVAAWWTEREQRLASAS